MRLTLLGGVSCGVDCYLNASRVRSSGNGLHLGGERPAEPLLRSSKAVTGEAAVSCHVPVLKLRNFYWSLSWNSWFKVQLGAGRPGFSSLI